MFLLDHHSSRPNMVHHDQDFVTNFEWTPRVYGEHSWPIVRRIRLLHSVLFRMSHSSNFRTNRDRSYTHLKSTHRGLDKTGHMCNLLSSQQTTPDLTVWHIHRFLEVTQTFLSTSEEAKLILLSLRSFFISKKKIGRRRRARRGVQGAPMSAPALKALAEKKFPVLLP